ncbi:phospholipase D1-like [Watersipora subatra]|uniref:phospholipase D1-like n=1 Tax=Watersipora subatra TaxID=2589382 RepID=UPI00355C1BEA
MNRQGSVLSTLSDYDLLDTTNEELDPPLADCDEQLKQSYLKKNRDIYVKVSVRESHGFTGPAVLGSTRLYDVDCYHSRFRWCVVRSYSQFEELHRALVFYRASLRLNRNTSKKKDAKAVEATGIRSNALPIQQKVGRIKNKALKFPAKPELFVFSAAQVERRRRQLEDYLNSVLKDSRYRSHDATMRFVELSPLSFRKHSGEKFHENFVQKRSGGRRFSSVLACVFLSAALWNKRWLVLKDSYICYLRSDNVIADVMLFDQDFGEVKVGFTQTKIRHGILITNTTRELAIKTNSHHKTRYWAQSIQQVADACEYVHPAPHRSFAPQRKELAHWYVDAVNYFEDVASALQSAREEIFITDWWLTPELFLRRPVVHLGAPSRLDRILHSKAEQGVKVYILLYKEIEMAVGGIRSFKCKTHLESLHPNIKVMRHPDHIKSSVYLWTHHEKIVCIDQTIAFLGGLDLCFGRWDNSEHRLTDLGSVQSVTPPSSRPTSTVATVAVDWKGLGVDDLTRQRKRELSGKGSRRVSSSETTCSINSLGMLLLSSDLETLNRAMASPSQSVSDTSCLRLTDDESTALKSTGDAIDCPIGDNELNLLSEHDSKSSPVSPKLSGGEDKVTTADVFADDLNDLRLEVLGIQFTRMESEYDSVNSELIALPFEEPDGHCSSIGFANRHSLDRLASIAECNSLKSTTAADDLKTVSAAGSESDFTSNLEPQTETNILFLSTPDCSSGLANDLEAIPELDATDTLTMNLKCSSHESDLVTSGTLSAEPESPLASTTSPNHTSVDESGADTSTFSITAAVSSTSIEKTEIANVCSMDSKETDKRPSFEPVQGFSYIESARVRKSRSKVPTRPPEKAYLKKVSDSAIGRYARTDRVDSVAQPPVSRQTRSWKKIRNNMDKVKRVWTHEESVRRSSELSSIPDSRCSTPEMATRKNSVVSGAIASKYWLGKDYVNWIHKDLTSVKAPFHDSVDRFSTVRMPWHDIACVIFNKAATDISRHFIQRWNFAKKVKDSTKSSNKYPLLLPRSTNVVYNRLPSFIRERCELVNCQILRSCSGWSSGMQNPENSIYNAYMSLIEEAEQYIYIENQFFISWCGTEVQNCICEALVNRILKAHKANETFRVYIVLPLLPAFEADLDPHKSGGSPLFSILHYVQQSLNGHDNSLFKTLYKHGLDPSRYVYVCGLRNHGMLKQVPVTELIYVHSKLMIVDDKKCIIGSANINDRSLAGDRDSEIAVLIQDEFFTDSKMSGQDFPAGKFCYSLRNHLFQEHLGLRPDEFIQDITCEEFYKKTWVTTAVHNTTIYAKVFNCLPCDSIASFEQLRLYRQEVPLATSDPVAAKMQLSKVKGHLVMYPLQFLKNEVLRNHMGTKETFVPSRFWT